MRLLVPLFVLAALALGTTLRRASMKTFLETRRYEDIYYLPETDTLPVLSLGHREALADFIWLKALIYTGDEYKSRGDLENAFRYADAMLVLDPDFRAVYRWIGTVGTYRPTGVTLDDHRRTIAYLERSVQRFPNDGELHWELGAAMEYELAPLLPAGSEERRALSAKAREEFILASSFGAGPPWIGLSSAMDLARAGQVERALAHLKAQHALTSDERVRVSIEIRIAELEGEAAAETLRAERADIAQRHRREFPYVSEGLYILLRPRIRPAEGAMAN